MATYLVFGATGGTGKHFLPLALGQGHTVRALVRTPAKTRVAGGQAAGAASAGCLTYGVMGHDAQFFAPSVSGGPQILAAERLNKGVVVKFDDGRCCFYPSALLCAR